MESRPFFVTGAPKSGTTWLGKLLDAHPEVSCKGEACMLAFTGPLANVCRDYNQLLKKRSGLFSEVNEFPPLGDAELLSLMRHFVELRLASIADHAKPALKLVGEKDPTLTGALPLLNQLFPAAKVVHIIRDGRAAVVSAWFHNLRFPDDQGKILTNWGPNHPGPKAAGFDAFLETAAQRWSAFVRTARRDAACLGDRYLEIRYEDLLADPAPQLRRVLDHLGADSNSDVMATCIEAASFEKMSRGRVRGQEDQTSFFRKGLADDWKNHMTPAQATRCNALSGGLLEELGYLN